MSVTLVRKESDTPNITNADDIRGFRYGGLGVNGVVKGYLNECQATVSTNSLQIGSGEIILDGWQVDLDASGATIIASNISGLQYYTVYLEVDLSISDNKTATIKATMDSYSYPTIDKGDDISVVDTGIGRLPLYTFDANGGTISNVQQVFEILDGENQKAKYSEYAEYASEDVSKGTIEERLTRLGFREGSVNMTSPDTAPSINSLKRQGNYVLCHLVAGDYNLLTYASQAGYNRTIGRVPEDFMPLQETQGGLNGYAVLQPSTVTHTVLFASVKINLDGYIVVTLENYNTYVGEIVIGYEAKPLE